MRGERIRLVIVGLLGIVMLAWGCPEFLHGDQWYISLAHHFFHVNVLHIAINCISIWALFRKGYVYQPASIIVPFLCATASWFVSPVDPAGASNFIYAVIGCRTPPLKSRWWRSQPVVIFLIVTCVMLLFPQVSAVTHIVSFVLGVMCAHIFRYTNRKKHGKGRD
jgi:membrane associated rhomboid family serine protease